MAHPIRFVVEDHSTTGREGCPVRPHPFWLGPIALLAECQNRHVGTPRHRRWKRAMRRAKRHARSPFDLRLWAVSLAVAR